MKNHLCQQFAEIEIKPNKIDRIHSELTETTDRMLTKEEVAKQFGMTVSWLNNSQNDIAVALRACGIKLGRSPSSPVRFPAEQVRAILNGCNDHAD